MEQMIVIEKKYREYCYFKNLHLYLHAIRFPEQVGWYQLIPKKNHQVPEEFPCYICPECYEDFTSIFDWQDHVINCCAAWMETTINLRINFYKNNRNNF